MPLPITQKERRALATLVALLLLGLLGMLYFNPQPPPEPAGESSTGSP